jgi:NAD-dependent deacetylase
MINLRSQALKLTRKPFWAAALFFLSALIDPTLASLLTSPPSISEEEINERANSLSLDMTWEGVDQATGQRASLGFERKNGQTILKIQFEDTFPQTLQSFQKQFTHSKPREKNVWTFLSGHDANTNVPELTEAPLSLEEAMGQVHPPLTLEKQVSRHATLAETIKLIRDKKCVFYTGAGISAGVVPTMPQLEKELKLTEESKGKFLAIIEQALKDPETYRRPMDRFYEACLYGRPTKAHEAVRDIASKLKWGVLTENLDLLHQRSGINPLHHDGSNWLKSNVTETDLKLIDYVITIGLARDESGFLGWYKHIQPQGVIIAINLEQPEYLSNEDLLVTGDVQELLPQLSKEIIKTF